MWAPVSLYRFLCIFVHTWRYGSRPLYPLGGGGRIRTCVALRAADLQSAPINHSGTPPGNPACHARARGGIRTRQPIDYKSIALPLRHSGIGLDFKKGKEKGNVRYYTNDRGKSQGRGGPPAAPVVKQRTYAAAAGKGTPSPAPSPARRGAPARPRRWARCRAAKEYP
jgi:hypothetical protein